MAHEQLPGLQWNLSIPDPLGNVKLSRLTGCSHLGVSKPTLPINNNAIRMKGVLLNKVSSFQGFRLERFHCSSIKIWFVIPMELAIHHTNLSPRYS